MYGLFNMGSIRNIEDLPEVIVERQQHYFRTYKMMGEKEPDIQIIGVVGPNKAKKIVTAAIEDYKNTFGQGKGKRS